MMLRCVCREKSGTGAQKFNNCKSLWYVGNGPIPLVQYIVYIKD